MGCLGSGVWIDRGEEGGGREGRGRKIDVGGGGGEVRTFNKIRRGKFGSNMVAYTKIILIQ